MSIGSEIKDVLIEQMKSSKDGSQELVQEFVSQMKSESDAKALDTVSSASALLAKAIESDMPQSVKDAYERIITRASSR